MAGTTIQRCTHCGETGNRSAVEWQAHRLDNYATHRGPARYTNNVPAPTDATRSLVDSDQGVCPDGHACTLTLDMSRTCTGGEYTGDPLTRWDITTGDIDTAERNGARSDVVALARYALSMREPEPDGYCPSCAGPVYFREDDAWHCDACGAFSTETDPEPGPALPDALQRRDDGNAWCEALAGGREMRLRVVAPGYAAAAGYRDHPHRLARSARQWGQWRREDRRADYAGMPDPTDCPILRAADAPICPRGCSWADHEYTAGTCTAGA